LGHRKLRVGAIGPFVAAELQRGAGVLGKILLGEVLGRIEVHNRDRIAEPSEQVTAIVRAAGTNDDLRAELRTRLGDGNDDLVNDLPCLVRATRLVKCVYDQIEPGSTASREPLVQGWRQLVDPARQPDRCRSCDFQADVQRRLALGMPLSNRSDGAFGKSAVIRSCGSSAVVTIKPSADFLPPGDRTISLVHRVRICQPGNHSGQEPPVAAESVAAFTLDKLDAAANIAVASASSQRAARVERRAFTVGAVEHHGDRVTRTVTDMSGPSTNAMTASIRVRPNRESAWRADTKRMRPKPSASPTAPKESPPKGASSAKPKAHHRSSVRSSASGHRSRPVG
jgi:hypothetical protein